jgi:hypothetical protein
MAAAFSDGYPRRVSEVSIDSPAAAELPPGSSELFTVLSSALSRVTVKGRSSFIPRLCEADAHGSRAVVVLEPRDPSEPSVNAGHVDFSTRSALLRSYDALERTLSQRFPGAAPEVDRESYAEFLREVQRLLAEHAVRLRVSAVMSSTLPPTSPRPRRWLAPILVLCALAALAVWFLK